MTHRTLPVLTLLVIACAQPAPTKAPAEAVSPKTEPAPAATQAPDNGLVEVASTRDADATFAALKAATEAHPALGVMAEFDHTKNASGAGLSLRPTRVLVLGNPKIGSPLMEKAPTLALDLPQRMLVYQKEGAATATIVYNDPTWLLKRHGIDPPPPAAAKIAGALAGLAKAAAGTTPSE